MRSVLNQDQFTPFGLWIRQHLNGSHRLSVTNLDYILEDFKEKKIQLFEEKTNGGVGHKAQLLTFEAIDWCLRRAAAHRDYDYWGFFILQFPKGVTMPGPGMTLNDHPVTCEELVRHMNFEQRACDPFDRWPKK